jgi:hypothetical protein
MKISIYFGKGMSLNEKTKKKYEKKIKRDKTLIRKFLRDLSEKNLK